MDSQESNKTVSIKNNRNLLDENTKTKKFIDALETVKEKDDVKEFTPAEENQ